MPIYNHEGGSEASGDKGEKYKQAIEEYLRARGFSIERRSNHHSTTEDLAAVGVGDDFLYFGGEKVGDAVKEFWRVEAKATKLSRLDDDFLTELARVFIDYCEEDGQFAYHIFASYLQAFEKWERIFDPRKNTPEHIEDYFETMGENQKLNEAELTAFNQLDLEDFERFLGDVFVHRATWNRLGQMAEDERGVDREKWDFYTRENAPVHERETLVANFLRISGFPESIYIGRNLADHPEDIFVDNPRHLPIWVEEGSFYSLLPPSEMSQSLIQFVEEDSVRSRPFLEWLNVEEEAPRLAKRLFNRAVRERAVTRYEGCKLVRHRYENRLLFEHETEGSDAGDGDMNKTKIEGWDVAMDWSGYAAHRYANPVVKRYDDQFYVFIDTGWMFSRSGRGASIIDGDLASELHNDLQSAGHGNPNNLKAQFRQWRAYLWMDGSDREGLSPPGDDPQELEFDAVESLRIGKRPPKNTEEREHLMQRGVDDY
ncbi:hypothetical protein N0B31_05200 [Salinirubellus salinus]|uniref:Restriction endonuclease n=1 Tax=Salinirubellus salinus TaxID=1364945 RepID=A0A9E7U983_9EURY|nr:hypothetical protein [Salinirubellus salinus]UWM55681.1 hypothetical protein N0B31_05200 [Salinirubellus salinus]